MPVNPGRFTDSHSGPLVVFIVGMRINKFLSFGKWIPVAKAMIPMIEELSQDPESGFLGAQQFRAGMRTFAFIQYWKDFESLEAYARDRDRNHWPAWTAFNKAVGNDGSVGIFHETYLVPAGGHETIYGNMPPFGLGKIAGLTPATGSRNEASSRLKANTL